MTAKTTILTGVTNNDRVRLQRLVEQLGQSLNGDDLSFLQDLAGDLSRVKTMLPEAMRKAVKDLDDAQAAFEAAWDTMKKSLDDVEALSVHPIDARNPAMLQDAADTANRFSQLAAEAALRAQALKALIVQYYNV